MGRELPDCDRRGIFLELDLPPLRLLGLTGGVATAGLREEVTADVDGRWAVAWGRGGVAPGELEAG